MSKEYFTIGGEYAYKISAELEKAAKALRDGETTVRLHIGNLSVRIDLQDDLISVTEPDTKASSRRIVDSRDIQRRQIQQHYRAQQRDYIPGADLD